MQRMTGVGVSTRRATLDDLPAVVERNHALASEDAVRDPFIDRSWAIAFYESLRFAPTLMTMERVVASE